MSDGLTSQNELDHAQMWSYMRRLLERVFAVLESDTVIDDCLDVVVDLFGADRGLILLSLSDGTTHAVNARAQNKSLPLDEREEISRTLIRRALDQGDCAVWDGFQAEGSPSMSALGIVAALAAPLHAGGRGGRRGVLYVDLRDYRRFVRGGAFFGPRHVEFFMAAALLLGAVIEQHDRGRLTREHLGAAIAHTVESRRSPALDDLLGWPSLRPVADEIRSALAGDAPIFILGESGSGKTVLANAIAEASGRRPIVRAVLGSSDDLNTITSELFGHERGAFSGAAGRRVGLVEYANHGTLILDEVLNLPVAAQKLLLDFTQFGNYRPLGHDRAEPKQAKVRLIAATNGDLRSAIRDGRFRQDLYYRLAAVTIELPPLRHRRQDIPALAESTLKRLDPARAFSLSLSLRRLLLSPTLEWSGNVRQLERVIERARERALARDPEATVLSAEHVEARDVDGAEVASASQPAATPPAAEPLGAAWQRLQGERERINDREKAIIGEALTQAGGVVAQAARTLGIARTTLSSRIEGLGLRPRPDR